MVLQHCSTALRCAASHDNTAVSLLVLVAVVLVLRNERCEGCGVPASRDDRGVVMAGALSVMYAFTAHDQCSSI